MQAPQHAEPAPQLVKRRDDTVLSGHFHFADPPARKSFSIDQSASQDYDRVDPQPADQRQHVVETACRAEERLCLRDGSRH